jgi:hypothetical protein
MSGSVAPVDDAVLRSIRDRVRTHPVIDTVTAERTGGLLSMIQAACDPDRYPAHITAARLEIRWYTNDDYNFHYIETHAGGTWQCRWDRHPNPHTERTHFHPPPDARSTDTIADTPPEQHPAAMLTRTLANIRDRIETLWKNTE